MKQIVTIQENKDGCITAGCDKSQCAGCSGSFFCTSKKVDFQILNPENIDLKKGDKAIVEMESRKTLFSIFMSLIFPILMFIPGYFIGAAITDGEGIRFIAAMASVAIGFLISGLYFRFTRKKYLPVVVQKEDE